MTYHMEDSVFTEFYFYSGLVCSRNYARAMNIVSADYLGNEEFAIWFSETYGVTNLKKLNAMKMDAKQRGYGKYSELAYKLAYDAIQDIIDLINA